MTWNSLNKMEKFICQSSKCVSGWDGWLLLLKKSY